MESSDTEKTEHRLLENLMLAADWKVPKPIRTLHYSYANNRYLSLRDLASALSGTPKQFDITISDGVIHITSKEKYIPVGGENTPFPTEKDFRYETENLDITPIFLDGRELKYYGFLGRNSAAREDCFLNLTDLAMQMDLSLQLSGGKLLLDTSRHFLIDRHILEEDSFYFELHSAVVGDAGTGEVYLSWEPDLSVPVASTSKLMSYAVIMDAIAEGIISSEDQVMVTEEAELLSQSEDGVIALKAGTEVPLCELLDGMLIASSNECTLALAVHTAGSEEAFVERMLRKAERLGLSEKVRLFNCHGLPVYTDNLYTTKVQNRMTANDMFLLVRHIMECWPQITEITSRKSARLETLAVTVGNSNPLLFNVPGVVGLKTGTTNMARNCLVTLMQADDAEGERHNLVAVQFGAEDETVRTSVSEVLIRYAKQRLGEKTACADRLEGNHICLRKAEEKDFSSMLENVWGDEAIYQWMLFQPTLTEEDAKDRCRRSMHFQKDHLAWFVALKDTDEAIGLCAMREYEPGHFEECGICIGTKYQGQGYGKEILALLLDLAFHKLGAEDFRYGYFRENARSKKLAESFHFRYDRSYELTRPWDGAQKQIDSCILTREDYLVL